MGILPPPMERHGQQIWAPPLAFWSTALIQPKITSLGHAKSRSEHTRVHATKLDSFAVAICLLAHGDNALHASKSVVPTAAEPSEQRLCLGSTCTV